MSIPFEELNRMTPDAVGRIVARGADYILQGHRLGSNTIEHVDTLLTFANPPMNARVVDLGCGFGEPAKVMRALRGDLLFWLVNGSQAQLDHCPDLLDGEPWCSKICCDIEDEVPLGNGSMDMAMFMYALCQMDVVTALREAHRLVRLGGTLFLFEPVLNAVHDHHLDDERRKYLWSQMHTLPALLHIAEGIGWRCSLATVFQPKLDPLFRELLAEHNLTHLVTGMSPAVMRFTKES